MAEGARAARLGRSRRVGRVRAHRGSGAARRSSGSACPRRRRSRFAKGELAGIHAWSTAPATRASRASSCSCMADDAAALWDAVARARRDAVRARCAGHAAARGLLPAARQGHRARHRRDLGRPRLGLRARQGLHRRRGAAPDQGGRARRGGSPPFVMEERAVPRQGMAIVGRRRVTSARTRRCSTGASAWATCPPAWPRPERARRSTSAAGSGARASSRSPSTSERSDDYVASRELSGRPALPPCARLGTRRRRRGDARASPGTRRTRSASSSTSSRPRSARRSRRTTSTARSSR